LTKQNLLTTLKELFFVFPSINILKPEHYEVGFDYSDIMGKVGNLFTLLRKKINELVGENFISNNLSFIHSGNVGNEYAILLHRLSEIKALPITFDKFSSFVKGDKIRVESKEGCNIPRVGIAIENNKKIYGEIHRFITEKNLGVEDFLNTLQEAGYLSINLILL